MESTGFFTLCQILTDALVLKTTTFIIDSYIVNKYEDLNIIQLLLH